MICQLGGRKLAGDLACRRREWADIRLKLSSEGESSTDMVCWSIRRAVWHVWWVARRVLS